MNTYEILKQHFTRNTKPGTFGHLRAVNECCEVFMAIRDRLTDTIEATEAFNGDQEVRSAILARGHIAAFRHTGVI